MPYPKTIETKLEFDQVKELTRMRCLSPLGQQYIEKIRFVNRHDLVEKMLTQVKEFTRILAEDTTFPNEHYYDIAASLNKARIEGIWLIEEELQKIRISIATFLQIARYLRERNGKYPQLESLLEGLIYNDLTVRRIDRILDTDGNMRPNASPELSKISAKIQARESDIRKKIQHVFDRAQDLGYLAENIGITIRDGRLVLPVLAEHKRHVPGFVHDESHTGQTVFIEPADCFEMNNILRELQLAYRRERERILLEVTDQVRPDIPELEKNMQRMGLFDFIRAKALLALEMKADLPVLSNMAGVHFVRAFHPLLKLNHDKAGLKTVPLNIRLDRDKHIMVISGPNAGGKSVCLKTVGLLQYMLQTGFLVPCDSHSETGIFKDLMVDIGDEQSIENDLSTYSSHLLHMKHFTDFADSKTLFLIDEFGMGTDPQFGGPLAEAILHHLAQKRAFGIVTTHFSNLKNFASNAKGLINASMLFDHEKMQPLYELETGKPGSSYAFEIAGKTGLNRAIIEYAKARVGEKQKRVDDLLVELEKEKKDLHELRHRFAEKEAKTSTLLEHNQKLKTELEQNRRKLIADAKQEALSIISEASSKVEAAIREVKEKQADAGSQRFARQSIRDELKTLREETKQIPEKKEEPQPESGKIEIGSLVKVPGHDAVGEVLEIHKNKAVVAFGDVRTTAPLDKLVPAGKPKMSPVKQSPKGLDLNEKMQHFSTELNLIGKRGEEALRELEQYIDDAYLLGFKQVKIIHGKGFGILRKLVRDFLSKNKMVESVVDEHMEMGGDGATIVNLNI